MEAIEISIEPRVAGSSRDSRRIRKSGFIPAIVFARGEKSIAVQLPTKEFSLSARQVRSSQLFTLKSSLKELNGRSALVKEIQRDHLSGAVLHVDVQALHENEEIDVKIPLKFLGEATGVKTDGGILTITAHEVTVRCLPRKIPSEISIEVTPLKIGDSIHARDLKLPEGVKLTQDLDETIVSVVAVRQIVEEVAAVATPAEGEAAAAAAGAAPGAAAPAAGGAAPAAAAAPAAEKKK